ncbi:MAG: LamG domain-containing protein [Candidatus Moranbacteria bacterium]|nr:LamG domain-containing protein [Candidatus Moranbacteria bacterium]
MSFTLHRTFQYLGITLIFSAIGGGYWYWKVSQAAQTVESDTPSFEAPLTHDLNLSKGQGIATYSRADGADRRATVTDFEGRIIPVKQNEARFEGARRVENLLSYTQELDNAYYFKLDAATVTANQAVAPDGMTTADLIDISAASGTPRTGRDPIAGSTDINRVWKYSIYLRSVSGSGTWNLRYRNADNTFVDNPVTIDTTWKRYSVTIPTVSAASVGLVVYTGYKGGSTIYQAYAWGAQVEEVTGQANQNPSEYVSTNVKTAFPYHGAGVDGVKYFDTQNGNTVASNVVTEATGAKIASSTLKGYLAEGSRTNLQIRSEFGSWWIPVNATITSNAVAAPSGLTTAATVFASDTSSAVRAIHSGGDTTVAASTAYVVSVYVKASGENYGYIQVNNQDSSVAIAEIFNLSTGASVVEFNNGFTNVSTDSVPMANGWRRLSVTLTTTASTTGLNFYFGPTSSSSARSYTGTVGNGIAVWGAQLEQAAFASSYIPTTTASVTRSMDLLSYPSENANSAVGSAYAEAQSEIGRLSTPNVNTAVVAIGGNTGRLLGATFSGSPSRVYAYDGTASIQHTSGGTFATPQRIASKWSGSSYSVYKNGSGTSGSFDGSMQTGVVHIGSYGSAGSSDYGTVKNVRIWKKALSDTELQNMTSTTEGIATSAVKETTIANVPSNTGLVGYWSFEDGSGTRAEDFSPTSTNTGTLTNGPTWVDGKIGKALSFDGVNQYVLGGNSSLLDMSGSLSVSFWIKPSANSGRDYIFAKRSGGGSPDNYNVELYNNKVEIWTYDGSWRGVTSTSSVTIDSWENWVVTYSSGIVKMYRNGVLDKTDSTTFPVSLTTNTQNFSIGGANTGASTFEGSLDDVRLYDRALTASEIAGLYAQGNMGKTTVNTSQNNQLTDGLVGLWSFNGPDLSGTTAYDRSGQGNNGTLVNGPSVYPGKVGQALSFDGTSASVNLGQPAVLQTLNAPMTISSWVRFPTAPVSGHNYTIIGRGYDWQIEILPTQRVSFRRWSSYSDVQGVSALSATSWYHVVVTVSTSGSDNVLIYVNGQLDKTGTMTTPFNTSASNTRISGYIQADIDYFNGLIDEVRIYNRVLSAAEVAALYQLGR